MKPLNVESLKAQNLFFATNDKQDVGIFVLWCKAYMRGELIKLASQINKNRQTRIDTLLRAIRDKETITKVFPTHQVSTGLMADRLALANLLLHRFEVDAVRHKAHHYHFYNKPGKILANKLRSQHNHSKIAKILHAQRKKLLSKLLMPSVIITRP